MSELLVTSDTHLNHNQPFIWEDRGFISIQEHNEIVIERWNSVVRPQDIVYHLGDIMLGNADEGLAYLRQLNGHIRLVIGNHDTDNRLNMFADLPNIEDIQFGYRYKYSKRRSFVMSHYPMLVNALTREHIVSWNLCGHVHTFNRFEEMEKGIAAYHCEMEAHNCTPINIEDITQDINRWRQQHGATF